MERESGARRKEGGLMERESGAGEVVTGCGPDLACTCKYHGEKVHCEPGQLLSEGGGGGGGGGGKSDGREGAL